MSTTTALTYEVRVDGHLDDHWAAWLGDLTLTRNDDATTTLKGPIADQAQLHGVLARLRDMGATLLSLRTLDGARTEVTMPTTTSNSEATAPTSPGLRGGCDVPGTS